MTGTRSPHDDIGELRARLLASGRTEKPSAKLLGRTLAAIGAGAASGLGAASTAGATTSVLARAFFWKWLGLGVLGGAVTIGAWQMAAPSPTQTPVAVSPVASPVAPPPSIEMAPTAPVASTPASSPAVATRSVAAIAPVQAPSVAPSAPRAPGLVDEIAALDEARRAMAAGDSSAALRALDRHAKDFPSSQLDHEAAVLRVESMLAGGQCEAARAQAASFLRANPRSPVASRMNTLMSAPCPGSAR